MCLDPSPGVDDERCAITATAVASVRVLQTLSTLHIDSELPKVLIKVHFWALFWGKELFWVLFWVLLIVPELF